MELKKMIRENAYLWLGRTKGGRLLLIGLNGEVVPILCKATTYDLTLYVPSGIESNKDSIVDVLGEIYPGWRSKSIKVVPGFTQKLHVIGDYNKELDKKGIKYFKEAVVYNELDKLGYNRVRYKYTAMESDNSFNSTVASLQCGYQYYSQVALDNMKDVSEEKGKVPEYPWLHDILKSGVTTAMLLVGGPGTGKSTEFKIFCAQNEVPCYVMQLTSESLATDVTSEFIPNIEDNSSPAKLKRSPFTIAYEHGGIVIIDEINMASAGSLSALNSALDGTKQIILADGTVIKRNPNFRCVATMNPNLAGTRELNIATMNRFFTFYWPEIDEKSFVGKLSKMLGDYNNSRVLTAMYKMFDKLRNIYRSRNYATEITVRNAELFMKPLLEVPNVDIKNLFDCAFIYCMVQDFIDIPSDIKDLQLIRDELLEDFMKVYKPSDYENKMFEINDGSELSESVFSFGHDLED